MKKLRSAAVLLLTLHLLITPLVGAQVATPEAEPGTIATGSITVVGLAGGDAPVFAITNANGAVIASGEINSAFLESVTFIATPGTQATLSVTGNDSYDDAVATATAASDGALHFTVTLEPAPLEAVVLPESTPSMDVSISSDSLPIEATDVDVHDLTVAPNFGGTVPDEKTITLYDAESNLVASVVSTAGAQVVFEAVPDGVGYTVQVEGSWWYPDFESGTFDVNSTSSNNLAISIDPYDSFEFKIVASSSNNRQLDQPLTLILTDGETAGSQLFELTVDSDTGELTGTITAPKKFMTLSIADADAAYSSSVLPWNDDYAYMADEYQFTTVVTPAPLFVEFNIAAPEGVAAEGNIVITQGEDPITSVYVSGEKPSITQQFDQAYGMYDWSFAPGGAIAPVSGTFVFDSDGAQVPIELAYGQNGVITVVTTFPDGIPGLDRGGTVGIELPDGTFVAERTVSDLGSVSFGPLLYGDYLISVRSHDANLAAVESLPVSLSGDAATLNVSLQAYATLDPVMVTFRVTGPNGDPVVGGWVRVFNFSETFVLDENGEIELNLAGWNEVFYSVGAHSSSDSPGGSWVPTDGNLIEIQLEETTRLLILNVVNDADDPIPSLTIEYGGGVVNDSVDGVWYVPILDDEATFITISITDNSGIYLPLTGVDIILFGDTTNWTLEMEMASDLVSNTTFNVVFEGGFPNLEMYGDDVIELELSVDEPDGNRVSGVLDADGNVTFANLVPGTYDVEIENETIDWMYDNPVPAEVEITESGQSYSITLEKAPTVQFTILIDTSDGLPLDDTVVLEFFDRSSIEFLIDGPTMISVPYGDYEVWYSGTGQYEPGQAPFIEVDEESDPVTLTLTFTRVAGVPLDGDPGDEGTPGEDDGDTGDEGTPGEDDGDDDGDTGDDGTPGDDDGDTGDDGSPGDDGTTGKDGTHGDGGDDGNDGATGNDGTGGDGGDGGKGGDGGTGTIGGNGGDGGSGGNADAIGGNGGSGGAGGEGVIGGSGGPNTDGNGGAGGEGVIGSNGGAGGSGSQQPGSGGSGGSDTSAGNGADESPETEPTEPLSFVFSLFLFIVQIFIWFSEFMIDLFEMLGLQTYADAIRVDLEVWKIAMENQTIDFEDFFQWFQETFGFVLDYKSNDDNWGPMNSAM